MWIHGQSEDSWMDRHDEHKRCFLRIFMFRICAEKNIYTYVVNQQMHTDKICFTMLVNINVQ